MFNKSYSIPIIDSEIDLNRYSICIGQIKFSTGATKIYWLREMVKVKERIGFDPRKNGKEKINIAC